MSKVLHLRVEDKTAAQLKIIAKKQTRTISSLGSYALRLFVEKEMGRK